MEKQGDNNDSSEVSEHYNLETEKELRHLKAIITALREELDLCHGETEQQVSEAVRNSNKEINQLKEIAQSLRAEIDNLLLEKEQAVQKAQSESANEIAQLKNTVQNQRQEMENQIRQPPPSRYQSPNP